MSNETMRFRSLPRRILSWLRSSLESFIPVDSRALSWARRIHAYDEVPEPYRPFLDNLPSHLSVPFPYAALTPTFEGIGRQREIERLICLVDGAVYVVEQHGDQLSSASFPLQGQCWIERGALLLHSWITVHNQCADVAAQSATLRFNTVTEHLMAPFVDALRAPPSGPPSIVLEAERARFGFLAKTDFKFMSFGQGSIRPGAQVIMILHQARIRRRLLHPIGFPISRPLSAAHLTILTDSELILIRDDDRQRWSRGSPHGAIWTYVPRAMIQSASVSSIGGVTEELSVGLTGGTHLKSLFDSAQRGQLEQLVEALTPS